MKEYLTTPAGIHAGNFVVNLACLCFTETYVNRVFHYLIYKMMYLFWLVCLIKLEKIPKILKFLKNIPNILKFLKNIPNILKFFEKNSKSTQVIKKLLSSSINDF